MQPRILATFVDTMREPQHNSRINLSATAEAARANLMTLITINICLQMAVISSNRFC